MVAVASVLAACYPRAQPETVVATADAGVACRGVPAQTLDELWPKYFDGPAATGCAVSGCHATGTAGLKFKTAHELWQATVGKQAIADPLMKLVAPGDPQHSYFFRKLLPGVTVNYRMPSGGPYLNAAGLAEVAGWICAGAPEPANPPPPDGGADAGTDGGTDGGGGGLRLDGFSPESGLAGTPVTLTGSGFSPTAADDLVAFAGTPATVTFASATSLTTSVPAGAATGRITIALAAAADARATSATDFQVIVPNPAPHLASVTPGTAIAGAGDVALSLTGDHFIAFSTAELDGDALPTAYVSATTLGATVPAANLAVAGSHVVTVVTHGPGGGTSAGVAFVVDNPAPAVSALSPSSVLVGSAGVSVLVGGSGFVAGSQATWNGAPARTAFTSATQLSVAVPDALLATAGHLALAVTNLGPGGGSSVPALLTVANPSPRLATASPSVVVAGSGPVALTLTGASFVAGSQVLFDGSGVATTYTSATQLSATLDASLVAAAGTHALTIVNAGPGGGTSASASFTVQNPLPTLTALSPASTVAGSAPLTLTATGSGFVPGSVVALDGAALTTTYVSARSLTAPFPAFATSGAHAVTVKNPSPGGGATSPVTFAVVNPAPRISALSPARVVAGSAFTLAVSGSGFVSTSQVSVNGTPVPTTFVDATSLKAQVAAVAAAGDAAIAVATPGPGGGTSAPATLTVVNPAPALTGLSPATVTVGSGGFTLTVSGSGFVAASSVQLDGASLTTTFASASQLTVALAASVAATAGVHTVSVVNPAPGGGASASATLTIANPAPALSAASPTTVLAGSGSTALTVTGAGFIASSQVLFDGSSVATTFASGTQLGATLDAALVAVAGTHALTVETPAPGGGTSAPASFTVQNPAPALASLTPASTVAGAAPLTVTATGTGFVRGSTITLDGAALATTFVSATSLTAPFPAFIASGNHAVGVTNPSPGGGATSPIAFAVVNPAPTISSLSPSSVTAGSPFTLTVSGAGFVAASQVSVAGASVTTTFVGATSLTAAVSALTSAGSAAVTVTTPTPGGGASAPATLTVVNPAPALAGLSPSTVTAGAGGFALTLSGSGFVTGSKVTLDGASLTTTFVSASQLTAAIDASVTAVGGTHAVAVTNPTPGGGTSATQTLTVQNPAPAISSISPSSVATNGAAFTLTVAGSGFVPVSQVQLNGTNVTTAYVSGASLTAQIPTLTSAGTYLLTVVNPTPGGGTSGSASLSATSSPTPSITGFTPTLGPAGSSFPLTLTGANFSCSGAGVQVSFNGTTLTPSSCSTTQVTVTVPATAAGTYPVKVTNLTTHQTSSSANYTLVTPNPVPTLSSLSPASAAAGSAGFTLTANGSGFASGAVLSFNGVALATTFVGATQVTADVPSTALATAGSYPVVVTNPAPGGGASNTLSFTAVTPNPTPALSSMTPTSAIAGGAGFTLTVSGSNFASASSVLFNSAAMTTTFVSSTQLTAAIPSSAIGSAGSYPVAVTSPSPGGGTSGSLTFTVVAPNPVPSVSSLSPSSVVAGSGAANVTISGSGFVSTSSATFNGSARTTTFVSSSQLAIALTAADTQSAGTGTIAVANPAPGGGTSGGVTFTVEAPNPVPVLSSMTPASAAAGGAGFTLTVAGSSFVSTSSVLFNGAAVTTTFVSATQLTAAIPSTAIASAGTYPVAVFNPSPGGGTSSSLSFPVANANPVPSIGSLTPSSVTAGSGAANVSVGGTGFLSSSTATFNGSARTVTFVSSSQLTLALTSADTQTAGSYPIVVTNPSPGGGASNSFTFTVVAPNPAPVVSSMTPTTAVAGASGFTLTVNGASFVSGATVVFNAVAKSTTFVGATQLTAAISASDIATGGSYPVVVTNPAPGGGASGTLTFTVTNPAPTLSSLSPSSVVAGSGAVNVTLSGSGFVSTSSATFNGSARTTTFVGQGQLTIALAATDTQSAGTGTIAVTNPTPGGGTSGGVTFTIASANPVPVLSSMTPTSAATGGSGFTLGVSGSSFVSTSSVLFNGAAMATTFVSSTQLTAAIPSSALVTAGTYPVAVSNPTPGGGISSSLSFTVATANPVPSITSLTPSSVTAGSGAVNVTVGGSGFLSSSTATFNGSARTATFVSSSQLTLALTSTDTQLSGSYPIVATNPSPGGGASNSFTFTVVAPNPVPVLGSLSPTSVTAGASGFTLTANGSSFVSGATVLFNSLAKTTTFVSSTQLAAAISSSDVATAGSFPVAVTNPSPGGGTSGTVTFTVNNPAPTLSSISPTTVVTGSGAFTLTVNGGGFVSSSAVQLDGGALVTTFVNTAQLTAAVPSTADASSGTHTLTVVSPSPGGGTSGGATLTVSASANPVPVVSTLSPCGLVAGAGSFTLTLNGASFVSGATATFNGAAVTVTFVSSSKLTAAIPSTLVATPPSGDAAPVVVTNPGPGGGPSSTVYFGVASKASALSANVQPIFTAGCATNGCHTTSGTAPMSLESGLSFGSLVGVTSTGCVPTLRVLACGPLRAQSVLVDKILATSSSPACSGNPMPKGSPLSTSEKQIIIDWVAQGAPNN